MKHFYSCYSHILPIVASKKWMLALFISLLFTQAYSQTTNPAPYAGGPTSNGTVNLIELYNILFNEASGPGTTYSNQYIYWNNVSAASIVRGQMHHLSAQDGRGGGYPRTIGMWIDYNSDNDFNDAGEKLGETTFSTGSYSVISQYFNVPATATLGATRVRIRVVYNTTNLSPTTNYAYGQTFDYDVDILESISPVAPPVVFDGGNIVEPDADLVHITNVTLGSINNNSAYFGTSTAGYNYSNFTGQHVTDLTAGQNYNLSVTKTNYTATLAAWIDFNNDGDFTDPGEEIGNAYTTPANTAVFNFTVPGTVPDATESMMRVRVVYDNVTSVITPSNTTFGILNSNNNNETEDYRINFINPGGCAITAGTASPSYQWVVTNGQASMNLAGSTGSTIQWQDSTSGGSWADISGATFALYTSGNLSDGTYFYRAKVTDGALCTVFSNEIEVVVAANPVYCSGVGASGPVLNNHIEDLGFHDWTDPNPGYVTGSYYDYTNTGTYGQATVVAGQYHHYGATLRSNGSGTASTTVAAWIDYDQNGVFDNTPISSGGELIDIHNFTSTIANTYAVYHTVPTGVTGDCRMRIRALRGNFGSIDPCASYTNSQTKDLTVTVLPDISGGQVCGTVSGSADVISTNSTVDLVNITRVHVTGPSGTVIDHNSDFFGFLVGLNTTMYNYSNFMGSYSSGLEFDAGAPYSVSIEHSGYTNVAGLFIDWNGDGDFLDADELVGRLSDPNTNPFVFNFVAPSNLVDGTEVAMRVRMRYDDAASLGGTLHACNNILDGFGEYSEVEDYRATLNVEPLVCGPVTNITAAIGDPANGTAHHMAVSWDHITGALSYDIDYSTNGSTWTNLATSHLGNTYDHNTSDSPNVPYYYRVRAKDGTQTCAYGTMGTPVYTACDVPAVPITSAITGTTMDVSIATETPVANPAITTYSIFETTTGQYVQASGTLGATEVFQTKATWGAQTVTGLSTTTEYCFLAKARNFDGDERGGSGATILTTQEFNSDVLTHGATAPTTSWFAPNSNTPLAYTASGGCTGGHASYSGAWNSFWGNFIRTPEQDCTGEDEVILNFDISHSYFATHPNDRARFYMWVDGAYDQASSIKIGGVEVGVTDINGIWLYFTEARSCVNVSVTYDLTSVTNKSNILFYLEASSGYNNSDVFSVSFDNITLREAAETACATTLAAGSDPDLIVQSITPNISNSCSGGTVSYDVVVQNNGTQAILNGTSFDVSAYNGSLVCGGTAYATQSFSSGLGVGATTTLTFPIVLAGSADVSFEVDVNSAITESNEANNCGSDNSVTLASGLGGTYTINTALPTGGSNFASFADAASALNTVGVCSAVIFDVATDTYNENIILTDVAGVSAVNTVTFRSASGVASQVTLQRSTTDVVVLHNADYFRFENMTIDYNGTSSFSAIELQDDADNLIVDGCILDGSSSTSTSNTNAVIYANESTTSLLIDNMVIQNSTLQFGGNGIHFSSGSVESQGIVVDGNTFSSNSRRGMYLDDCTAPQVTGNTITSISGANSSYAAIDIDNSSGAIRVLKNNIGSNFMKSGIVIDNSDATSGNEALVANNFIFIGGTYNAPRGIDITGSDYVNVYFNTVSMTSTNNSLGYAALYVSGTMNTGTVNIVNNIFSVTGGGSSQTGVYLASTNNRVDIGTIDYNNYYATGSASIAYSSGDYTLATWQTLLSDDANSIEIDPQFTSATDLHVGNNGLKAGTAQASVTDDIDGDIRVPTPTMGADEIAVPSVANDATPTNMNEPSNPCPGSNAFEVEVTNLGTNNLTSFTLSWTINSVPQTPVNVTGINVPQFGTTNVSLGNANLVSNTAYNVVFTTSLPNGAADDNSPNDALTETNLYTALSGTYTVGGASPDFTDFNDAADALHAYGVCGAVVFNVREGTYTEQVQFNAIAGVSVANDVTFQADPANTNPAILQYNSQTFSDNYVLGIYGTSYLRFDGLTINTTNTGSYRRVINFLQGNLDIHFTDNIIEGPLATSNSTNYILINSSSTAADKDDEILFDGNTITNGSYGIYLQGTSSAWETDAVITNNTITGFNAFGVYLRYRTNATVDDNVIRNGYATANATGIDFFNVDGTVSIQRNIIECSGTSNTKTGINTGPTNLTSGNRGVIANNFISVEGTSTCQGLFLGSTTSYVDVLFNNVYTNGTNASSTRAFYMNGASNIRSYNNNFVAGGAGYAMYILSPITGLAECDNNNYYTGNTEFIYRSGNQADLATWQGLGLGYDASGLSIDPQYTSTTSPMDLHVAATGLAGAGTAFGGITIDIDGDARATPPAVGADEIANSGCGTVITWTGTIDTDWHKPGNWGCGQVPTKTHEVVIPSAPVNQPVIFGTFTGECKKIDLNSGSSLLIKSAAKLDVNKP